MPRKPRTVWQSTPKRVGHMLLLSNEDYECR